MYTNKIRHWAVALGLVAFAGITGASAAGFVHHTPARSQALPVPSGDLGEVVVVAPRYLGEAALRARHDLGEVLVTVHREPVDGAYLAHVVVTVPRDRETVYTNATEAAATLASAE